LRAGGKPILDAGDGPEPGQSQEGSAARRAPGTAERVAPSAVCGEPAGRSGVFTGEIRNQ